MFLRIATGALDPDSHQPQGVFMAAHGLLTGGELSNAEADDLRNLLDWFNANMPCPGHAQRRVLSHRAIFWFRPCARAYVKKAWELVQLLRLHGLMVEVLKTRNPGSVVYADHCQVAAIPLKGKF